ncbi:LOW QUALITY PROTEIN: protocadherin alpha-4-like, partial [Piliocolobus tephrosceles]|uniref:LOW QUALITY PROTEIN: protocadherin alpha-4-like n=1 Tax=Piliocolobus tephrosceles TaxID=591936 RepID=UPI000E6B3469
KVYALQPLDHEELELLQFQVSARDAGVPPLGSNVTLQVFVLDENDNAPALLAPQMRGTDGAVSELVLRSVGAGVVVGKVRAVDADSGYNAWLSYEVQPETVSARIPFRVGLYTGEISTTRALDETDAPRHRLLVLVKDHGEPALTATATVLVSLVDSGQAPKASSRASVGATGPEVTLVDVNVYLIIAICAVSSLLVLTLLLYTALRCSALPTEGECTLGKPTLVCSSEVGSWSYSQQRRQRCALGRVHRRPTSWLSARAFLLVLDLQSEWENPLLLQIYLGRTENVRSYVHSIPLIRRFVKQEKHKMVSRCSCLGVQCPLLSLLLLAAWEVGSGQLHYSVYEEAKHGSFVGRITQDLGLELAEL